MNENFDDYFASLDKVEVEKNAKQLNGSIEQKHLNLTSTKTQGTVIFRPIADLEIRDGIERCIPIRRITNVYEIGLSVPALNDDGTQKMNDDGTPRTYYNRYKVCGAENFITKLTPEQYKLHSETTEAIDAVTSFAGDNDIDLYNDYGVSAYVKKEVSLFWGKVFKFTSSVKNANVIDAENKVFLMRAASPKFSTSFNNSQKSKTEMKGSSAWRNSTFSRTVGDGNYGCSITTALNSGGTIGYSFTINFDEISKFKLTQEDIDKCTDLNAEYCDVTTFNEDYYTFLRDKFIELKNKMFTNLNGSDEIIFRTSFCAAPEKLSSTPSVTQKQVTKSTGPVVQPDLSSVPKFKIPTSL